MKYGTNKRTVATRRATNTSTPTQTQRSWTAAEACTRSSQWNPLDFKNRSTMERSATEVSTVPDLPSPLPAMEQIRSIQGDTLNPCGRPAATRQDQPIGSFYRRFLRRGQKRGSEIGKTKRGKGSKIMAVTDGTGLPIAVHITSASPHEVTLVEETLDQAWIETLPEKLIGDKAYDSDSLDEKLLEERGIQLIAPNRCNKKQVYQDGRPLRRYKRRWRVERLFAWLQNFRRLVVRYEHHASNFLAMVHLGCIVILLRYF